MWKNIRNNMTLESKFVLHIIVILLVSTLFTVLLSSSLYFIIVSEKTTKVVYQHIEKTAREVENSIRIIENIAFMTISENAIEEKLLGPYEDTTYTKYYTNQSVIENKLFLLQLFYILPLHQVCSYSKS